tara:strand:- start:2426 stop:2575 length:150 start_codon:yes stop_codon:yes gene_type:complete
METVLIFVMNADDGVHASNDVVTTNNDRVTDDDSDGLPELSELGKLIAD